MPVVSLASPKGGAGKTTLSLLLATELANAGGQVEIIDADPQGWSSSWRDKTEGFENVRVTRIERDDELPEAIDEAAGRVHFVIVDVEGTANMKMAHAVSMSDLVLIPVKGSYMEAVGATKCVGLIRSQERVLRRQIPYRIVLNSVGAAVKSRDYRELCEQLEKQNIPKLDVEIVERAAYRAFVKDGGSLHSLDDSQVNGLENAKINAEAFMKETVEVVRALKNTAEEAA